MMQMCPSINDTTGTPADFYFSWGQTSAMRANICSHGCFATQSKDAVQRLSTPGLPILLYCKQAVHRACGGGMCMGGGGSKW